MLVSHAERGIEHAAGYGHVRRHNEAESRHDEASARRDDSKHGHEHADLPAGHVQRALSGGREDDAEDDGKCQGLPPADDGDNEEGRRGGVEDGRRGSRPVRAVVRRRYETGPESARCERT